MSKLDILTDKLKAIKQQKIVLDIQEYKVLEEIKAENLANKIKQTKGD